MEKIPKVTTESTFSPTTVIDMKKVGGEDVENPWVLCGEDNQQKTRYLWKSLGKNREELLLSPRGSTRNPQGVWITFLCGNLVFSLYTLSKQQTEIRVRRIGSIPSNTHFPMFHKSKTPIGNVVL